MVTIKTIIITDILPPGLIQGTVTTIMTIGITITTIETDTTVTGAMASAGTGTTIPTRIGGLGKGAITSPSLSSLTKSTGIIMVPEGQGNQTVAGKARTGITTTASATGAAAVGKAKIMLSVPFPTRIGVGSALLPTMAGKRTEAAGQAKIETKANAAKTGVGSNAKTRNSSANASKRSKTEHIQVLQA
jgi:hypothetical protein